MTHRSLTAFAFTTMAAVFAAGLLVGTAHADEPTAPKPCAATSFKFKPVEAACKKGGQAEAKTLMKNVVKKMKGDGKDVNCKSCHTSLDSYALTSNAEADLKPYI